MKDNTQQHSRHPRQKRDFRESGESLEQRKPRESREPREQRNSRESRRSRKTNEMRESGEQKKTTYQPPKKFRVEKLKGSDKIIDRQIASRNNKQKPPEPVYDGTTRLNKYISNAGICSRREADKLIEAGAVSVNGEVVTTLGYKVREGDVVSYGGQVLRSEPKRYFLLNKPKGYITTLDDPHERNTVMKLVEHCCKERIYPVGRLDRNTTGLLLFTNDGEMARKLTHPSSNVYKIYQVTCDKAVTHADMKQMVEGVELEDGFIVVDDVQYQDAGKDKRIVGVALHSGRNRIVRRIFEHFGYDVVKLDRVVFAGLTKKDLPRGRARELTQMEVNYLQMI